MRERGIARVALVVVAVAALVAFEGCWWLKANPTPPGTRLVPTIVGVVTGFDLTPTATIYKLADGRTVAEVYADKDVPGGGFYAPGNLVLARTTAPKYLERCAAPTATERALASLNRLSLGDRLVA